MFQISRKRSFLQFVFPGKLAILLMLVSLLTGPSSRAIAAEKPNVIVILVDDMGWSDLGCYGSEIDTPNLDRLAAEGLRMAQFYNTAKCSQTRATLLSGQFHNEVGIMALKNCWTLAEAMHEAGYHTIMAGKWHLNSQPTERGFDRYFGHLSGATDFFAGDKSFRLNGKPFQIPESGFYTTDANTDYAIEFIDDSKSTGKPFFCYLAYNAPHYPLQAPEKDVMKYRGKYAIGWDKLRQQRFARQKELGLLRAGDVLTPRPPDVPAWESLDAKTRGLEDLRMATYAAMIDKIDQNIGRLTDYLKQQKMFDDTLIMFMSDNGACPFDRNNNIDKMPWEAHSHWTYDKGWAHACNTPWREYKQNQHEGGISSPFIAHWPNGLKAKPGSITFQTGHLVDVMATLLDLTETAYPAEYNGQKLNPLRGESLLPIFAGKERTPHEALYFDFANKNHALRIKNWKLVSKNFGPWELYDVEKDRSELHDLSDLQPDRKAKMIEQWESWAKQAGVIKPKKKSSQ